MTGATWLAEQGLLGSPIAITNTHCVGLVRDAILGYAARTVPAAPPWLLPVAAETYDGWLSTADTFPITREMVFEALDSASCGTVPEGNVGGGTGMICHEFKGGSGTSSRLVEQGSAVWTVGAFVQANYGRRAQLTVCGVSVGREIGAGEVPLAGAAMGDAGSIIVVLATDAPLLPIQCQRLARRATIGLGRVGGIGANGSGDIFIAFSSGNRLRSVSGINEVRMIGPEAMTSLFAAAAEATEEAILNALTMAETTTGRDGRVAHAIPLDRLVAVMKRHRFGTAAAQLG
jgi:D-aminopeptidase